MIYLASTVFLFGYILISAEHRTQISKSAIAMLVAATLWVMVAAGAPTQMMEHLSEAGGEIFEIVVFLLSAMTLVEILVHYRFFDVVRSWLLAKNFSSRRLLWVISALSFFLSAIIDNMTTTIIMTQLSRLFFKGKDLIVAAALIVISANSGGAFSPIGDVTTTMLWLKGMFSSAQIISQGFIPSLVIYLVAAGLMVRKVTNKKSPKHIAENFKLQQSEKLVIAFAFGSFSLPFIFHSFGLKPYLGLLAGLGLTWTVIDILKKRKPHHHSHFTASIERLLQQTDISSLKFFIGILLAVAALNQFGVLESISNSIFGNDPGLSRFVAGSSILGVLSAVVDNVPLTAAAMDILKTTDSSIWVLLALTVGTGGSILVIGSAAGVVAMGIIKELNFANYLKVAGIPASLGYFCGILTWYLQRTLL